MSGGTKIYGIAASENRDKSGELFKVDGCDDTELCYFNDEHTEPTSMNLGVITGHAKIFSEKDCKSHKQLKCWNLVKTPFLYVEGELMDNMDHPFAQATGSLIKFAAQNPEYQVPIGFSIEGGIVQRVNESGVPDKEGKILAQTLAKKATITVKPCNPKCHIFVENDLAKSRTTPPANLAEILAAPEAKFSFRDNKLITLAVLTNHLKKSIQDYQSGMTSMKCLKCGQVHRFFKSSRDIPNHCGNENCRFTFTLRDIWNALSR